MQEKTIAETIFYKLRNEHQETTEDEVIALLELHPECLTAVESTFHDSLLQVAAMGGKLEVMQYLTGKGIPAEESSIYYTPLHYAITGGYHWKGRDLADLRGNMVEWLLKEGANPNGVDQEKSMWTPLAYAATYGELQIVKLLLAYGAEINAYFKLPNGRRYTNALWEARSGKHEEVMQYLLDHGAQEPPPAPPQLYRKEKVQQDIFLYLGMDLEDIFDFK